MSDRGLDFSAKHADTSFVMVKDEEAARRFSTLLREKAEAYGKPDVRMAAVFTVVAADTDAEADALIERIRAGADVDAVREYVRRAMGTSVNADQAAANAAARAFQATLLTGSPQSVADQMNAYAAAGVDAFLLTFPDFVADLEYFGREVLPLLDRKGALVAEAAT
jgi:pyrimidine oxygenase